MCHNIQGVPTGLLTQNGELARTWPLRVLPIPLQLLAVVVIGVQVKAYILNSHLVGDGVQRQGRFSPVMLLLCHMVIHRVNHEQVFAGSDHQAHRHAHQNPMPHPRCAGGQAVGLVVVLHTGQLRQIPRADAL